MHVLIAEDDPVSRRLLEVTLGRWKYQTHVTDNGRAALDCLTASEPPRLAILDWMMPEMDGPEVCRRVRAKQAGSPSYLVLLTAKGEKRDIVAGLDAGADDYMTKPFDIDELRARLRAGERTLGLRDKLALKIGELETALHRVEQLQGLLPICSYCKRIRDDQNYWQAVETYICAHSRARFSHGICPDCMHDIVAPELARLESTPG